MKKFLITLCLLLSASSYAGNFYIDVNGGMQFDQWNKLLDSVYIDNYHSQVKDTYFGAGLDIGYSFNSNLSLEVGGLVMLDKINYDYLAPAIPVKDYNVSLTDMFIDEVGVLTFPADKLSIKVKAGIAEMKVFDVNVDQNGPNQRFMDTFIVMPVVGLGIDYKLTEKISIGIMDSYYMPAGDHFKGMNYSGFDIKYNFV